ncbi:hypothetical protein LZ578_01295 [Jeotgalibaca sp. MA1X17-3]|uniref:hypothetical protein n=1 Tax=Jeotgalibaca sp. MA1X17-3 TaxID=2908211 RepID=UPI001F38203C|nr:hypothetical protein [Jeotgalibaca sp. MA1X17-3]UJF15831.1 hypothetical protein LZ578_01295 [Jeotgalibaca sp. MA1X17-3]
MKKNEFKKIPKLLLITFLFFSILGTSMASASEYSSVDGVTTLSNSVEVGRVVRYNKKYYCSSVASCVKGKIFFPQHLWITSPWGHAGYIPIREWYESSTEYVVTYAGFIYKGPYVPTMIDQEK